MEGFFKAAGAANGDFGKQLCDFVGVFFLLNDEEFEECFNESEKSNHESSESDGSEVESETVSEASWDWIHLSLALVEVPDGTGSGNNEVNAGDEETHVPEKGEKVEHSHSFDCGVELILIEGSSWGLLGYESSLDGSARVKVDHSSNPEHEVSEDNYEGKEWQKHYFLVL